LKTKGVVRQELDFAVLVENLGYEKLVEVHWAGEDSVWQNLKAGYEGYLGNNRELWRAQVSFSSHPERRLPGNIRFALHYGVSGREYWDNNCYKDYRINADSGILLGNGTSLLNIGHRTRLERGEHTYPITVAVDQFLHPKSLSIRWTSDNWKTRHQSRCFPQPDYWLRTFGSNARNPNQYGIEIWKSDIGIGDGFRIEYAVSCDTGKRTVWDNNFGGNYLARRQSFKVLTLNLHCYQEDRQDEKFNQIARAISDLNVDAVCFQEVAENWNQGRGEWKSNAARIIRERLKKNHHLSFHLYTDWSHIGFDRYREGTAILSRYKFLSRDSGYISRSRDPHNIHARRVVMVQVHVPYMGPVNIFSCHLSWWSDGFREQFENLKRWADLRHRSGASATLLCGDFNSKAGSRGYRLVAATGEYEDAFLKGTSRETFDKAFRQSSRDLEELFADDHRIDYIFIKKGSSLHVTSTRTLFTEYDYGRVSDHCGYVAEFEPN
jgi:maltose 6'-phosphate phosphatase